MTRGARRNVAAIRFSVRRVTAKARRVRVQSRRNRQRDATTAASMTRRTFGTCMFRMIEPDVETAQRWERFHLPALRVRMADRTDLTSGISKLLLVTTGAGCMRILARQRRSRRVVRAAVTKQTRQPRMIRIVVFELRVVCLRKDPSRTGTHGKDDNCNE